jgi:peptidyl-prolyl cis-trans isomerase SurA
MSRGGRWVGMCLFCLALGGCMGNGSSLLPKMESPAGDITEPNARLARSQRPEGGVSLSRPTGLSPAEQTTSSATTAESGTQQTTLRPGQNHMTAKAWVNGKPIFDDEVMYRVGPEMRRIQSLPEPRRSEVLNEMFGQALETLIDEEVAYQDGVAKLEKANPRALDKLRAFMNKEIDKQLGRWEKSGITPEQIREIEPVHRRVFQRNFLSSEYVRSKVMPFVESIVGLEEIKGYYEDHKNEFQNVDKVKWQHVFIASGPGNRYATPADARRFAEQLLATLGAPEDFSKLIRYDDGLALANAGEGVGQRRGEIRPAELEETLFRLSPGEVGPILEGPNGIHLVRVVKREYAGQIPLNEETQKAIRRKLQLQLSDREYKRVVREMRARAIIQKDN